MSLMSLMLIDKKGVILSIKRSKDRSIFMCFVKRRKRYNIKHKPQKTDIANESSTSNLKNIFLFLIFIHQIFYSSSFLPK